MLLDKLLWEQVLHDVVAVDEDVEAALFVELCNVVVEPMQVVH